MENVVPRLEALNQLIPALDSARALGDALASVNGLLASHLPTRETALFSWADGGVRCIAGHLDTAASSVVCDAMVEGRIIAGRTIAAVPLTMHGVTTGALAVLLDDERSLNQQDLALLDAVSSIVSLWLGHSPFARAHAAAPRVETPAVSAVS